ncbi:MAG: porin [Actinomycetota bacterium]
MKVTHWLLSAGCCLAPLAAGAAETPHEFLPVPDRAAEAPLAEGGAEEITPKDWSYQAIEDLASRGLVHGYKDAKFLGGRTLSRYEMASVIKRVIHSLLLVPVPADDQPLVSETPGTAASRGLGNPPPPLGRPVRAGSLSRDAAFRETDVPVIRRLADAYSVELAVIGVDLQSAMQRLTALEGRVEAVEKTLNDPEGPVQKALKDLARIDKISFRGYVQTRYESFENTRESDPSGPRGPVTDRFTLRRMRLTLGARPTRDVAIKWELEGGGGSIESRDAFVSYFVNGNPATGHTVSFGQMKVPFGFEIAQSSGARETPERARPIRFFYPSERDRGIKISSSTAGRWFYELGLYNGVVGPGTQGINTNDNNNNKDVFGRVRTTQLNDKLDAGISFHFGNSLRTSLFTGEQPRPGGAPSAESPYENSRITLGADVQWHPRKGTELRGEYLWGKAKGTYASGFILQALQDLSKKNQLVIRYDWLGIEDLAPAPLGGGGTPVGDSTPYRGTLSNLSVGMIHRLNTAVRLKLFYEFHSLGQETVEYGRVPWQGNILRFEALTLF